MSTQHTLPTIHPSDINNALKRLDNHRKVLVKNPTAYSELKGSRYVSVEKTLGEFLNDNSNIFSLSKKKKEYLIDQLSKQFENYTNTNIVDVIKSVLEQRKTNIESAFMVAMFEVTNKCKLEELIL